MLYIKQITIIFSIAFLGEGIKYFIPIPIPSSIYGIVILFLLLCTKLIKLEQIKETGYFLIGIMPLMFIPAAVGLMDVWILMKDIVYVLAFITIITTIIVMLVSGWVTQIVIRRKLK